MGDNNRMENNILDKKIINEIDIQYDNIKKDTLTNDPYDSNPEQVTILDGDNPEENDEENQGSTGGKRKSKSKSKKVSRKPVVSQKKQSIYKEIFGKQMKIYKMPDSRKEYVKYKGELLHISDYKDLMKQKAIAKTMSKTNK